MELYRSRCNVVLALTVFVFAGVIACAASKKTAQPNILIFLADDQGWNDVPWHNPQVKMPNLERLRRGSIQLEQQYVCSMCTPTRASLMSGRFPTRFGISVAQNEQAMHFGTETLASALKSVGYDTALIGKWHLGSNPDWGPQRFGFDYSYGALAGGCGPYSHLYKPGEYAQTWHRNGKLIKEEGHVTDLIGKEAIKWLEARGDRPFFLYVPFTAPHVPIMEEQRWLDQNAGFEIPAKRQYYAAITHMDDVAGQILAALERSGKRDNTIILFLTDNGATPDQPNDTWVKTGDPRENFTPGPGGGSNAPLKGKKTTAYDGGLRVPAFVNWPTHLKAGIYNGVIHSADWMPTLTKLAGYTPTTDLKWDGRDMWKEITTGQPVSRQLYWVSSRFAQLAVRDGEWKLVITKADDSTELFDLSKDPNEQHNLAKQEPARVSALRELMTRLAARDNDAKVGDAKPE